MGRTFDFDINDGRIVVKSAPIKERPSLLHDHGWALITDISKTSEEWTIAFAILGPHMANVIMRTSSSSVQKIFNQYTSGHDAADPNLIQFNAFTDDESKICHILRDRFEIILKSARKVGSVERLNQEVGLAELRRVFAGIPSYPIVAAFEAISIISDIKNRP